MYKLDSKKIIASVFPFFILTFAWILAMGTLVSYNKLSVVFMTLPFSLAFFGLVLSVWFQHSRTFYAICILLFTMCIVQSGFNRLDQKAFINGISLVIPIAFILLAVVEEKGITTKHGLIKGLVLISLILVVLIDAGSKNPFLARLKSSRFIFRSAENIQSLPRMSVFLFVLCLCIMLIGYMKKSVTMDMAFTGVAMESFIILHFTGYTDVLSIFYSAAFLTFIIALFETSYSLAYRDTLTGLLSRRAMEQEVLRLGSKYAIAILDLDFFKRVNDKYGHKVGDDLLRMVAAIIEKNITGGKAFRYGGEEFVIIYPKKSVQDVAEQLDGIRRIIEKRPLVIRSANRPKKKPKRIINKRINPETVRITVSIGIADKKEGTATVTEIIEAADKALYMAKNNGRNCIAY